MRNKWHFTTCFWYLVFCHIASTDMDVQRSKKFRNIHKAYKIGNSPREIFVIATKKPLATIILHHLFKCKESITGTESSSCNAQYFWGNTEETHAWSVIFKFSPPRQNFEFHVHWTCKKNGVSHEVLFLFWHLLLIQVVFDIGISFWAH